MSPYIVRLDDEAWEEWSRTVDALTELLTALAEQLAEMARAFMELIAPLAARWHLILKRLQFEDTIACITGNHWVALWISRRTPDWVILKLP